MVKAIRVIWLPGAITAEQRYHAAKALFESGQADWDAALQAANRTPGIFFASEDPSRIDEVVRRLREAGLQPQITARETLPEGSPLEARHAGPGLVEMLPERLQDALKETLAPGESVDVSLHYGGQALVVTNERVLLFKTAFIASSGGGRRVKSYPFAQITSVDLRTGWVGGHVQITVPGSVERYGTWGLRLEENAFVFQEERLKPLAKSAVEIIRARVKHAQDRTRSNEATVTSRQS